LASIRLRAERLNKSESRNAHDVATNNDPAAQKSNVVLHLYDGFCSPWRRVPVELFCQATVARLLKDMGFSLKANKRKQGRVGCPERGGQFKYIASQKQRFITAGWPIISIDTKKKELIQSSSLWLRLPGRTD
jgi:hypothetical protein